MQIADGSPHPLTPIRAVWIFIKIFKSAEAANNHYAHFIADIKGKAFPIVFKNIPKYRP